MGECITLAKAYEVFIRESGCNENDIETLRDRVQSALEFMAYNGGGDILREWTLNIREGRVTLPRDLATPLKYKFGRRPNGGHGAFYTPYQSYSSSGISNCCDMGSYQDWSGYIESKANKVYTQHKVPKCGAYLLARTCNEEDVGKTIMVDGMQQGMPITPTKNNYKLSGQILKVYHVDDPEGTRGDYWVDDITGVHLDEGFCDWVTLSAEDRRTGEMHFLSHYHPDEKNPCYKEVEIFGCPPNCCDMEVSILGRMALNMRPIRHEENLPIRSIEMLEFLAMRAKYKAIPDLNQMIAFENVIRGLIIKEESYVREPMRALDTKVSKCFENV